MSRGSELSSTERIPLQPQALGQVQMQHHRQVSMQPVNEVYARTTARQLTWGGLVVRWTHKNVMNEVTVKVKPT